MTTPRCKLHYRLTLGVCCGISVSCLLLCSIHLHSHCMNELGPTKSSLPLNLRQPLVTQRSIPLPRHHARAIRREPSRLSSGIESHVQPKAQLPSRIRCALTPHSAISPSQPAGDVIAQELSRIYCSKPSPFTTFVACCTHRWQSGTEANNTAPGLPHPLASSEGHTCWTSQPAFLVLDYHRSLTGSFDSIVLSGTRHNTELRFRSISRRNLLNHSSIWRTTLSF